MLPNEGGFPFFSVNTKRSSCFIGIKFILNQIQVASLGNTNWTALNNMNDIFFVGDITEQKEAIRQCLSKNMGEDIRLAGANKF